MKKEEARKAIIEAWMTREPELRTPHQAAIFAIKAMTRYEFQCRGDRYLTIKGWLTR